MPSPKPQSSFASIFFRDAIVFLFFLFLTIILTWPVSRYVTTCVPLAPGDTQWTVWLLGWNYETLFSGRFADYWNANIFYPHSGTLMFSERSSFIALMGLPVLWLTGNLLAVHNVMWLLSFALSGYGMFRLTLYFVRNPAAAIFAGIAFAFTTYRFDHLAHLMILYTQWLPLLLFNYIAFLRERKTIHAVGFTFFFIANALSSGYYMMIALAILAMLLPLVLAGEGRIRDRKLWWGLFLSGLAIAIVALPFFWPQLRSNSAVHFQRDVAALASFSATPQSFLAGPMPFLARWVEPWTSRLWRAEISFFPGFLPLFLGLAFLFYPQNLRALGRWIRQILAFRDPTRIAVLPATVILVGCWWITLAACRVLGASISPQLLCLAGLFLLGIMIALIVARWDLSRDFLHRHFFPAQTYRGVWLTLAVLGGLLAMGPVITIAGKKIVCGPYLFFHYCVPGFSSIRAVGRFGLVFVLAICVLAAYGFVDLEMAIARTRAHRWALRGLLLAAIIAESISLPIPAWPVLGRGEFPAVYQWLARQPRSEPIAEIPMGKKDIQYMYFSTLHWHPMINGYSSFVPPEYEATENAVNQFPAATAVGKLRELGVKYAVVHGQWLEQPLPNDSVAGARLVQQFGDDCVYEIFAR